MLLDTIGCLATGVVLGSFFRVYILVAVQIFALLIVATTWWEVICISLGLQVGYFAGIWLFNGGSDGGSGG